MHLLFSAKELQWYFYPRSNNSTYLNQRILNQFLLLIFLAIIDISDAILTQQHVTVFLNCVVFVINAHLISHKKNR